MVFLIKKNLKCTYHWEKHAREIDFDPNRGFNYHHDHYWLLKLHYTQSFSSDL